MKERQPIIEIKNLTKEFDGQLILKGFDLSIYENQFVTFLGPSGCGKTTTLRMISGFEMPTSGSILLNGEDIAQLPPYKRPVNTVFQRYALFPHLDVYDNIAFGLKLKKVEKTFRDKKGNKVTKLVKLTQKEIDEKVLKALKIVDLEQFETRNITTLSGGQQQRVAIARAIVNDAPLILADEPTGNLDTKTSIDVMEFFVNLNEKLGKTIVLVTHEPDIAEYTKRTLRFKDGKIIEDTRRR